MNLLDGREALMDCILLEHIPSSNDEDRLHVILEAMEQNRRISFTTTTRSTSQNRMSELLPRPASPPQPRRGTTRGLQYLHLQATACQRLLPSPVAPWAAFGSARASRGQGSHEGKD